MKRLKSIFLASVASLSLGFASAEASAAETPAPTASTRPLPPTGEVRAEALDYAQLFARPGEEPPKDWTRLTTSKELMGKRHSGFDGAVFQSGDRYAIVFYGYNHLNDLGAVVRTGFIGVPRHELRDAQAFVEKAAATYGIKTSQMEFVGHSLGGYLAKAVGIHDGAPEIWTFNSPGFKKRDLHRFDKVLGEAAEGGDAPKIFNINSSHDVVGKWEYQPGQVFEVDTPCKHHAMAEMAAVLRNPDPATRAADCTAKQGALQRMFNRVVNSKFVQKRILPRFRDPGKTPKF